MVAMRGRSSPISLAGNHRVSQAVETTGLSFDGAASQCGMQAHPRSKLAGVDIAALDVWELYVWIDQR